MRWEFGKCRALSFEFGGLIFRGVWLVLRSRVSGVAGFGACGLCLELGRECLAVGILGVSGSSRLDSRAVQFRKLAEGLQTLSGLRL